MKKMQEMQARMNSMTEVLNAEGMDPVRELIQFVRGEREFTFAQCQALQTLVGFLHGKCNVAVAGGLAPGGGVAGIMEEEEFRPELELIRFARGETELGQYQRMVCQWLCGFKFAKVKGVDAAVGEVKPRFVREILPGGHNVSLVRDRTSLKPPVSDAESEAKGLPEIVPVKKAKKAPRLSTNKRPELSTKKAPALNAKTNAMRVQEFRIVQV